jgi:hypothetical protein
MLDQFDTSTQMAGDCDRAKILTPVNAQIGSFEGFMPGQGRLKAARAKILYARIKVHKAPGV